VELSPRKKDNWLTRFRNREENDLLRTRKPARKTTNVLNKTGCEKPGAGGRRPGGTEKPETQG